MLKRLGIIGCGKMAYALTKGIYEHDKNKYEQVYTCDIDDKRIELFAQEFASIRKDKEELIKLSDVIILAVKPAQIDEILNNTNNLWNESQVLISVAAGIKTIDIEKYIGRVAVVRAMPNTPCLIGEGVSAISGGTYAASEHISLVEKILQNLGLCIKINENYMDAVTAISGSGPAYVFLLVESMLDAAIQIGLNRDVAEQLVMHTFSGSIKMLMETGEHPAVLKAQVTSPGGTTIAGLRGLEAGGVRTAFFNAVEKAYQRSIEIGERKH